MKKTMTIRMVRDMTLVGTLNACLVILVAPSSAQEAQVSPPGDFTAIVEELSPAVVGIIARGVVPPRPGNTQSEPIGIPHPDVGRPDQPAPDRERSAGGSGFMVSEDC